MTVFFGRINMNVIGIALLGIMLLPMSETVTVTAYNAVESQTDSTPTITASNIKVRDGICAVSRDIEREYCLEFGDLIMIEGIGIFEFQDRTHKRKTKQVDIYMKTLKEAKVFGVQKAEMYVIMKG